MRFLQGVAELSSGHLRARWDRCLFVIATVAVATAAMLNLVALNPPEAPYDLRASSVFLSNPRKGPLPLRYAEKLQQLPEVTSVAYMSVLPLLCGINTTVTLNGFGGSGTRTMLADQYVVDEAAIRAWEKNPLGVLVGEALAHQCGWSEGMHLKPTDRLSGREIEIHISAVIKGNPEAPFADQIAIAHYDYLNRQATPEEKDSTKGIIAYASTAVQTARLVAAVEAMFAHDDPPVEAQQSTEAGNFLQRFGKIQSILNWIGAAMLACASLVVVSLAAHTAAERRRTFSVLRILGFSRAFIFTTFAFEFALLIAVGLAVGIGAGLTLNGVLRPVVSAVIGSFAPPSWIWTFLPFAFATLLLFATAIPAHAIARARPIDHRAN